MRVAQILISLSISVFVLTSALAQEKSPGTPRAKSTDPCCDNGGFDGWPCSTPSVSILFFDPGIVRCRDSIIT